MAIVSRDFSIAAMASVSRTAGRMPLRTQFPAKIGAKLGAMIARNPYSAKRPDRMFAARAAAEIAAAQNDLTVGKLWIVQDEIGIGFAASYFRVTPSGE